MDGWRYWGGPSSREQPAEVRSDRVGTSNLECITLASTGAASIDLQQLLSWLKAPRTLTFAALPHDGVRYEGPSELASDELQYALQQHQRQTLEHLEADGADSNCGSNIRKSIMLQDSLILKRVRIRADFLVMPTQTYEEYKAAWEPEVVPTHHIVDALPPALEELLLDTEQMFGYYYVQDEYDDGVQDLMAWISDIAGLQSTAFPALKSVGFTRPDFSDNNAVRYDQVTSIYKEIGIELYFAAGSGFKRKRSLDRDFIYKLEVDTLDLL
ncbi:MAG: hypothetical protein Q9164_007401 [Protoblastenia rupestris]